MDPSVTSILIPILAILFIRQIIRAHRQHRTRIQSQDTVD